MAGPVSAGVPDNWTAAASMASGHLFPAWALLPDGDVLVAGGEDASGNPTTVAEIYDPGTNQWTTVAPMTTARFAASAITLPNGNVLVVGGMSASGGSSSDTGEVYDPAANTWTLVSNSMSSARGVLPSVAPLPNGTVLIAGGADDNGPVATADIYNPATNTFSPTGSMNDAREFAGFAHLPDGGVLVVGGEDSSGNPVDTAEVYSPATGTWSYTANTMSSTRLDPGVAVLPNGKVLVASGGQSGASLPGQTTTTSTDLYDPATNSFTPGPAMELGRVAGGMTTLADGRVLFTGGVASTNGTESVATDTEIYDPTSNSWSEAGSISPTAGFAIQLLPDGDVLAAGGTGFSNGGSNETQLFTPTHAPGAPVAVSAAPGNHSAYVTFAPPVSDGGLMIERYTITASSGQTVSTSDGRTFATVTGLRNGKKVTFTVTATNALGQGAASAPSNPVTPSAHRSDRRPKLRLIGLARSMPLARFIGGVEFAVKPNKAVKLHIELLGRAGRATIAMVTNLWLAGEDTRMSSRVREIRLVPERNLVGQPRNAKVEVVIVATDKAGRRRTVSRWITVVSNAA